jgi:hypothetical protein
MAFTMKLGLGVTIGGDSVNKTITVSGTGRVSLSAESIADGQTDKQVNLAIDVTAVVGFYIVSSQNVTLETNNGTTPDDTLNLIAGEPYLWHTNALDAFLLTTDVTAFFITNASGSSAQIDMECVYDATP